jgi:hypothetical protein
VLPGSQACSGSSSCASALQGLAVQLLALEDVCQLLRQVREEWAEGWTAMPQARSRLLLLPTDATPTTHHLARTQRPDDCQRCHALLHTKAAAHFAACGYEAAVQLLTPAVFFASSLTVGKSARLLAAALLRLGQPARAAEYVGLAEQQQQGRATAGGCLIRLQARICMAAGAGGRGGRAAAADAGVMAAVQALAAADGFDWRAAQAAHRLCMRAGQHAAAWQVLQCWLTAAAQGAQTTAGVGNGGSAASAAAASPGNHTQLLQVLELMQQTVAAGRGSDNAWLGDLCGVFGSCVARIKEEQRQTAAASGCCHSTQQLLWLADVGLRLGVAAAQQGQLEHGAAVLQQAMHACEAGLLSMAAAEAAPGDGSRPQQTAATELRSKCVASACLAASLLLQQAPASPAAQQKAMQQAAGALRAAHAMVCAQEQPGDGDATAGSATAGHAQQLLLQLGVAVSARQCDERQCKQQLVALAQHPHATAAHLHAAALECNTRLPAAAALAYSHMLRLAAAAMPPAAAAVADAVAGLFGLGLSDAVQLKAADKVVTVLDALLSAAQAGNSRDVADTSGYPACSLQWLIARCWNAAATAAMASSSSGSGSTCNSSLQLAGSYLEVVAALAQRQLQLQDTPDQQRQQQQQQQDGGHAGGGAGAAGRALATHWLLGSQQYQQLATNIREHKQHCDKERAKDPLPEQQRQQQQVAEAQTQPTEQQNMPQTVEQVTAQQDTPPRLASQPPGTQSSGQDAEHTVPPTSQHQECLSSRAAASHDSQTAASDAAGAGVSGSASDAVVADASLPQAAASSVAAGSPPPCMSQHVAAEGGAAAAVAAATPADTLPGTAAPAADADALLPSVQLEAAVCSQPPQAWLLTQVEIGAAAALQCTAAADAGAHEPAARGAAGQPAALLLASPAAAGSCDGGAACEQGPQLCLALSSDSDQGWAWQS